MTSPNLDAFSYSRSIGSKRIQCGDDEVKIKPGVPTDLDFRLTAPIDLRVIEWGHMNLKLFYPAALTSTWMVRTALYPLAVLRSRLQLQKRQTVYRNTFHALKDITKTEGIRGLYRGFWVTVPQIGCSFIYSTIYEKLRADLKTYCGMTSVAGISCIAGGAASFASQAIFVPTDIIAQYMMVYSNADRLLQGTDRAIIDKVKKDGGVGIQRLGPRVVKAIYQTDGIAGFYRGFWVSSTVYVPSCLVFWPTYYWIQDALNALHPPTAGGLLLDQAVAAALGGMCSSVATNPMEVFRIRVQLQRAKYLDTIKRTVSQEGWGVFTKGLAPRLFANGIYSCVVMVGYEVVKRMCVLPEYSDAVRW